MLKEIMEMFCNNGYEHSGSNLTAICDKLFFNDNQIQVKIVDEIIIVRYIDVYTCKLVTIGTYTINNICDIFTYAPCDTPLLPFPVVFTSN